jgi:hypothetical protein
MFNKLLTGNTNLFERGSITVPLTSRKTGLQLVVVDVQKYFLYKQAKLANQEVDGTRYKSLRVG